MGCDSNNIFDEIYSLRDLRDFQFQFFPIEYDGDIGLLLDVRKSSSFANVTDTSTKDVMLHFEIIDGASFIILGGDCFLPQ